MTMAIDPRPAMHPGSHAIIGDSLAVRRLRATIEAVARTRLAVLIQGPTGAGKELVASAIHSHSGQPGPLVAFNVCAISESMFEDALFGHVRGAFTGAHSDSPGFLREADRGTVFLDEVSGLPPVLQAKLLRAIETGVFRPVGAKRDAASSFRVVAATNEDLQQLVDVGKFRSDFAQRLGGVTIVVPPLADRLDDIPALVHHFLMVIGRGQGGLSQEVIDCLSAHDWPGNVRELKHVVEWAAAFNDGHLAPQAVRSALDQRRCAIDRRGSDVLAIERAGLLRHLEAHSWNADAVARELGVHRATLYRRMKRCGVSTPPRLVW